MLLIGGIGRYSRELGGVPVRDYRESRPISKALGAKTWRQLTPAVIRVHVGLMACRSLDLAALMRATSGGGN